LTKLSPRERHLRSHYGITVAQYEELLSKQDGRCAICKRKAEEFKTRLAVDHDHTTLEIRGLLCSHCNHRLVGRHRDAVLLRRIADYIEQGTGLYVPLRKKRRRRAKRKT
jgi:hypothetical protein